MNKFIEKYQKHIVGTLSGFDRLVFRGSLRRLNRSDWDRERELLVAIGMEHYLWDSGVLFKDSGDFLSKTSQRVKENSLRPFREKKLKVEFVRDGKADKDKIARGIAAEQAIKEGLVCAISALEPSPTFDRIKSRMVRRMRPCHVLYHYQIHPQLGWLHARLQTWFPFNIQVALNGREWLARSLQQHGIAYVQEGNCFPWIEDFPRAQQLMEEQLKTSWVELLEGFAKELNPLHGEIFAKHPAEYYWTCYQSEWATDVSFREAEFLKRMMGLLTPHAIESFSCQDVLRFFQKRVNRNGDIPAKFPGPIQMNLRRYEVGERDKFWVQGNSTKFYDKAYTEVGALMRAAETTINRTEVFRAYRPKEGGAEDDLQWRSLRLGVADLQRRAEISGAVNNRLMDALASVDDTALLEELIADLQRPVLWQERRVRALRPFGDDHALLQAALRGEYLLNGFRNRDLQQILYEQPAADDKEKRRRSAAVSRKLRMLRAHGVIRKIAHTHRYQVSPNARATLVAILTCARTSLSEINQLRQKAA
jgi:hypothetical protein